MGAASRKNRQNPNRSKRQRGHIGNQFTSKAGIREVPVRQTIRRADASPNERGWSSRDFRFRRWRNGGGDLVYSSAMEGRLTIRPSLLAPLLLRSRRNVRFADGTLVRGPRPRVRNRVLVNFLNLMRLGQIAVQM